MTLLSKVMVPLDGSERAEGALDCLSRLFHQVPAELLLLQVLDGAALARAAYPEIPLVADADDLERSARGYLTSTARRFGERGFRIDTRVTRGAAAEAIVREADEAGASLLAMATHGRSGVVRWAMGSVTEKVLRSSHRPLLVTRTGSGAPLRHVLAPIDGSDRSLAVLPSIASLAAAEGAAVTLVHFVSDYFGKEAMKAGDEYLERARTVMRHAGVEPSIDLRRGEPAASIVDYGLLEADQRQVDLIAMSSHGRSGLSRMVLGSVAERVVRHAAAPVLVYRPEPG